MLRKSIAIILGIFCCFLLSPAKISAHVLKIDGAISAVMHIDPDDEPIAGSKSSFYFVFYDKQDHFAAAKCNCLFSITEQGHQIYSQSLFQINPQPSLETASVFFTFPKRDVYQVAVTGTPKQVGSFQPFNLVYDVRVDREASIPQTARPLSFYLLTVMIVMFIGGAVFIAVVYFLIKKKLFIKGDL